MWRINLFVKFLDKSFREIKQREKNKSGCSDPSRVSNLFLIQFVSKRLRSPKHCKPPPPQSIIICTHLVPENCFNVLCHNHCGNLHFGKTFSHLPSFIYIHSFIYIKKHIFILHFSFFKVVVVAVVILLV